MLKRETRGRFLVWSCPFLFSPEKLAGDLGVTKGPSTGARPVPGDSNPWGRARCWLFRPAVVSLPEDRPPVVDERLGVTLSGAAKRQDASPRCPPRSVAMLVYRPPFVVHVCPMWLFRPSGLIRAARVSGRQPSLLPPWAIRVSALPLVRRSPSSPGPPDSYRLPCSCAPSCGLGSWGLSFPPSCFLPLYIARRVPSMTSGLRNMYGVEIDTMAIFCGRTGGSSSRCEISSQFTAKLYTPIIANFCAHNGVILLTFLDWAAKKEPRHASILRTTQHGLRTFFAANGTR